MPTISIVIPIYNVELYLSDCIESILGQTFTDFELILVNDGSTDKCGEICEFYAKKDERIKVIHQANKGVSTARNAGIDKARGEFVAFVDPDDTIQPKMYKDLLDSALHYSADITVCPIKIVNEINGSTSVSSRWKEINFKLDKKIIIEQILPSIVIGEHYSLASSVNKLYKKSVFELIRFDENKSHGEDARLNFTLLTMIDTLVYVETPLYNYYIRKRDSLTQKFREDLYNYIVDNKTFLINLCHRYSMEKYIQGVKQHFMGVTLSYIHDVVVKNISLKRKYQILEIIIEDKEFCEDILKYQAPSIFTKVIKGICIQKNVRLLIYVIQAKIKMKELNKYLKIG